ncbi:MAG: hypothetical protein H7099_13700 [Gemmatimonadaceae bacterium]|nr:hypothetical protein [Gemmatimonadaceae bacterium]
MPHLSRSTLVVLFVAGTTAFAQGPPCNATTPAALGVFAGEFDVAIAFRAGPTSWDSTSGRASFAPDLDACLIVERFAGRRYGSPYSYLALWGASGDSANAIQRTFVHSQHGVMGLSSGDWSRGRDSLVVRDSAMVRGRWIHERWVLTRPVDGRFAATGLRSEDGGLTWFATARATFARR